MLLKFTRTWIIFEVSAFSVTFSKALLIHVASTETCYGLERSGLKTLVKAILSAPI